MIMSSDLGLHVAVSRIEHRKKKENQMQHKWIVTGVILALSFMPVSGQDLTKQQLDAARVRQVVLDQAVNLDRSSPSLSDSPEALDLLLKLHEASVTPAKKLRPVKSGSVTPNLMLMDPDATNSPSEIVYGGDEGYQDLFGEFQCTTNQYVFYNVPPFNDSHWQTDDYPPRECPWGFINDRPFGSGFAVMSYPTSAYYAGLARSGLQLSRTNTYDQFGDPMSHRISFWYKFSKQFNFPTDVFRFSMAFVQGDTGHFYTNLPSVSGWTRVSFVIPPYVYTNGYPSAMFTVFKTSTTGGNGPSASLDYVQWCAIETPNPTTNDFKIFDISSSTVKVQWNTLVYPTNKWVLKYAGDVSGPYSTYTNTAPTIISSNNVAYFTFTKSDKRFYRMWHKS